MSGADVVARGLAAGVRTVAQPLASRAIGQVGMRLFGGRMSVAFDNSAPQTFESLMTLAAPFDAVRLILAQSNTAGLTATPAMVACAVAVAGDPSDATVGALTSASLTPVTFGGAATGTLPVAPSNVRRAYLLSDWIPLASVPRTDGDGLPVLVARCYASNGATLVLQGYPSTNWTNWDAHPSGRIWKTYRRAGDFVSSGQSVYRGGATRTTNGATTIVGVQYLARGKVVNVIGSGDSITEGAGSSYFGEGYILPACVALSSNPAGVAYEYSDLGWSSTTMTMIRDNTLDAIAAGLVGPNDLVVLTAGSPNDVPGTIAAANVAAMRGKLAVMLANLSAKGTQAIVATWAPTNTAVKVYGATDALRRAYNDEVRGWARRGMVIADLDAAIAGVDDGSGQIQMAAGASTDGIHPNDAGNALMSPVLRRAIQRVVQPAAGLLVA